MEKITADNFITDDYVLKAAQESFHIDYLFPWQRLVIANILDSVEDLKNIESKSEEEKTDIECAGKQIVLLPTGAGKSLCFLTPALILDGPTLVLYPLLALMSDQKRRMDQGGLLSVIFKGGQNSTEREENFKLLEKWKSPDKSIKSTAPKIILANPEVLQNPELVEKLAATGIKHIAIDEAHCVSEWGDSFRPAYLTLGKIIKDLKVKTITAFTATASPEVLQRISEVLFDGEAHLVRSDSDRPNIHYNVINCFSKKRKAFELALTLPKPLIIFCGTRDKSEDMARELSFYLGPDKVKFYHAGLTREEKTATEKWFYPKEDGILCCTCAFGMGVDKKDIHTVIHLEPSPTAESYIQEAGRGGRDGSVAEAYLLWSPSDSFAFRQMEENSRGKVMAKFAESSTCRRQILLDALGGEQAVCSGCDVCRTGKAAPFAEDGKLIWNYVRHHKKMYNQLELALEAEKILNKKSKEKLGMNVWDYHNVKEVIEQLILGRFIRKCIFPFHNKLDARIAGNKKIQDFFYTGKWVALTSAENRIYKFIEEIKVKITTLPQSLLHRLIPALNHLFCLLRRNFE